MWSSDSRSAGSAPGARRAAAPLRAIILYKSLKAGAQLTTALALAIWWPFGLPEEVLHLSGWLHQHASHGWAARLAGALASAIAAQSASRDILLATAALGFDGILTLVEAWALRTGRSWGEWLVVITTGALLPVELYELLQVKRWSRALLLTLNGLIFGYLARRAGSARGHSSSR